MDEDTTQQPSEQQDQATSSALVAILAYMSQLGDWSLWSSAHATAAALGTYLARNGDTPYPQNFDPSPHPGRFGGMGPRGKPPSAEVQSAINSAAKSFGFNPDYMRRIIYLESAHTFDPNIANGNAHGLGQFFAGTWDSMMEYIIKNKPEVAEQWLRKKGILTAQNPSDHEVEVAWRAATINPDRGTWSTNVWRDADLNALATAAYADYNRAILKKMGIDNPTVGQIYAMHLFGEGDGAKLLQAIKDRRADVDAASIVSPNSLRANHLNGKTAGQVQLALDDWMASMPPDFGNEPSETLARGPIPDVTPNPAFANDGGYQVLMNAVAQGGPNVDALKMIANNYGLNEVRNKEQVTALLDKNPAWPNYDPHAVPWCAGFVGAVEHRLGRPGLNTLWANSYKNYGENTNTPRAGDIVVFHRHVAYYVGPAGNGKIWVAGGNQSDSINVERFDLNDVVAFRHPPPEPPALETRVAAAPSNHATPAPASPTLSAGAVKTAAATPPGPVPSSRQTSAPSVDWSTLRTTAVAAATVAIDAALEKIKAGTHDQQQAQALPKKPDEKERRSADKHFDGIKTPKPVANDPKETKVAANGRSNYAAIKGTDTKVASNSSPKDAHGPGHTPAPGHNVA